MAVDRAEAARIAAKVEAGLRGQKEDGITADLETVRLERKHHVFDQDRSIENFYIVRQGLLGIYRHVYPDKKVLVHTVGPDESAGVAQLMNGNPYPGQLIPIKETVAYRGRSADMDTLCQTSPADVSRLLAKESRAHDDVLKTIDDIIGKDLESRIANQLLTLSKEIGKKTDEGLKIIVKLTRKQISEMIGCAQESVIRVMSDWEKKNWIRTDHKYITILKPYKLKAH
jgi:CRP-like cAMP-binding protein